MSLEEVNEIASGSILPDSLLTVLVGDYKKISAQLKTENCGTVTEINYEDLPEINYKN